MRGWLFALAACVPVGALAAGDQVHFQTDIAPVLKTRCAVCHLTGSEAGKLALHPRAARASLVGRPSSESPFLLVAPGKPEASYLLMKLEGTHVSRGGKGARMPFGQTPLDGATIAKIRKWIAAGAPDD